MPTVTIRGREMFYEEKGAGFPIVFFHSFLFNRHMWAPQIDTLSKKYRCISIDLWAHGNSETRPEADIPLTEIADDVWELIETLKLEKFSFVGTSIGGMIGTYLALCHPEKIHSLTAMGSYVGAEPPKTRLEYEALMAEIAKADCFLPEVGTALLPYFFSPKTLAEKRELAQSFQNDLAQFSPDQVKTVLAIGKGIFGRENYLSKLFSMKVPTQYIVGADDVARPPSESHKMADLTPGAVCHVIPEAGHISNLEYPDLITQKIDDFIQHNLTKKSDWQSVA